MSSLAVAQKSLHTIAGATGALALLILIAVAATDNPVIPPGALAAAVVAADADFGSSHLHLEAAADTVAPGGATMLTWSATNITDTPSAISCFGNGTTCGTPLQTMSQSSIPAGLEAFSVGTNGYLLAGSGSLLLYKWQSAQNCFGNGTTCSSALQTVSSSAWWTHTFTTGGNLYVVVVMGGSSAVSTYRFMPPGIPASNTNGCLGNGTTCGTALASIGGTTIGDFGVFAIGSDTYLGFSNYVTSYGSNTRIFKWQPAQNCFGNGTSCGAAFQTLSSRLATSLGSFVNGGNTYIEVASSMNGAGTQGCTTGQKQTCLYKWQPAGTPASNTTGCFGNGTTCGAVLWAGNQYPSAPQPDTMKTIQAGSTALMGIVSVLSSTAAFYKFLPPGTPASNTTGCAGNGTACDAALQTFSLPGSAVTSSNTDVGTTTYVAMPNLPSNVVSVYKWQQPGTPASNTNGCLGSGTTCGTAFWSYNAGSSIKSARIFTSNNLVFLAIGLNNNTVRTFKGTVSATSPACSILWNNSGGSGTLANANSGSISTGALTLDTTYTLTCTGVGSVQITVRAVTAPAVTISAPASVVYGNSVTVSATFAAGSGDTLTNTAINGPAPTPVPGGYSWTLAPGLSWTPPTDKTFIFDPQALGLSAGASYTFIPDVSSQAYSGWDHSNNQSVVISVACDTGYTGSTCNQCDTGYAFNGSAQCVPDSCSNFVGAQSGIPTNGHSTGGGTCACDSTYTWDGAQCSQASASLSVCSGNTLPSASGCSFTILPPSVRKGSQTKLYWYVAGLSSGDTCSIASSPGIAGLPTWDGGGSSWTNLSGSPVTINTRTVFTLSCSSGGTPSSVSKTATLIPTYQEI